MVHNQREKWNTKASFGVGWVPSAVNRRLYSGDRLQYGHAAGMWGRQATAFDVSKWWSTLAWWWGNSFLWGTLETAQRRGSWGTYPPNLRVSDSSSRIVAPSYPLDPGQANFRLWGSSETQLQLRPGSWCVWCIHWHTRQWLLAKLSITGAVTLCICSI